MQATVKRVRSHANESNEPLLSDPETHRVVRLRARIIVNRTLEMAERVADGSADVPAEDQAGCITKLAKMYAIAIGFTVKQAARMTLVEALETVSNRTRQTDADVRARIAEIERYGHGPAYKDPETVIRATLKHEEFGGQRDLQEVIWYVERSFPDRAKRPDGTVPLYKHRVLIVAALDAVKRTAGRTAGESKTGESKKWKPIADLINAIGFGVVKPTVLPVEWSRWNRAADASAKAIQTKRRSPLRDIPINEGH